MKLLIKLLLYHYIFVIQDAELYLICALLRVFAIYSVWQSIQLGHFNICMYQGTIYIK